jgi:hypothetical protein
MRALRLRVLSRLGVALILAGIAVGPLAAPVGAAGECYWSTTQYKTAKQPVYDGVIWTAQVNFQYGYNCSGAIVAMKVTYARFYLDFKTTDNYLDDVKHTVYVNELWAWPNPVGTPAWHDQTDYTCYGGCYLTHAWTNPISWTSSAYTGSSKGFADAMFFTTCFDCGVAGGNMALYAEYNFPRNRLTITGSIGADGDFKGGYPF